MLNPDQRQQRWTNLQLTIRVTPPVLPVRAERGASVCSALYSLGALGPYFTAWEHPALYFTVCEHLVPYFTTGEHPLQLEQV